MTSERGPLGTPAPQSAPTANPTTRILVPSRRIPRVVLPATRDLRDIWNEAKRRSEGQAETDDPRVRACEAELRTLVAGLRDEVRGEGEHQRFWSAIHERFDDQVRTATADADRWRLRPVMQILGAALGEAFVAELPSALADAQPAHPLGLVAIAGMADRLERRAGLHGASELVGAAARRRLIRTYRQLSQDPSLADYASWALLDPWGPFPRDLPEAVQATSPGVYAFITGILHRCHDLDASESFRLAGRAQAAALFGAALDPFGRQARAIADLLLLVQPESGGFDAFRHEPGEVVGGTPIALRAERALWETRNLPGTQLDLVADLAKRHLDRGFCRLIHDRIRVPQV